MAFLRFLLLLPPSYGIAVIVHEAGHVACGALCGIPVRLVSIGTGPVLLRGRLGATGFELRLLPFSGIAYPYPSLTVRRLNLVLFYAGGVLANALLVAGVAALAPRVRAGTVSDGVLALFAWTQLYLVIVSLLPGTSRGLARDGLLIVRTLRQRVFGHTALGMAYARQIARYTGGKYDPALLSGAAARIRDHLERLRTWDNVAARREGREALLRELQRGRLRPTQEMLVLDGLVADGLAGGDPAQLTQLDVWSARALQLGPQVATLRASRGAVLAECGRSEEARALLAPLATGGASYDGAVSRLFLARVEHRLGHAAQARRLLDAIRRAPDVDLSQEPLAKLLARAAAEIEPPHARS